eukprot:1173185-Prorocentrum_minimum.AAC.1
MKELKKVLKTKEETHQEAQTHNTHTHATHAHHTSRPTTKVSQKTNESEPPTPCIGFDLSDGNNTGHTGDQTKPHTERANHTQIATITPHDDSHTLSFYGLR